MSVAIADEEEPSLAPQSQSPPWTGTDRLLVVIDMTPGELGFKPSKTDVADQKWDACFHVCKQHRFA